MSTAALQYAAALQETGCTLAQLEAAAAYLTGSAPLWEALCSPAVEANEKVAVLRRLPDFPGEGKLQDFLTVLARRGRFPLLPSIVAQYRQLKRREAGEGLCLSVRPGPGGPGPGPGGAVSMQEARLPGHHL